MEKLHIALLAGGASVEHEISLVSARNIFEAIDKETYEPHVIGVSKEGKWFAYENNEFTKGTNASDIQLAEGFEIYLRNVDGSVVMFRAEDSKMVTKLDAAFSVLHGTYGEDGKVQGFLDVLGLPYVGCGVTASAVSMDKVHTKEVLSQNGVQNAKYKWFYDFEKENISFKEVTQELGLPFFVKPANSGSSVGVSRVKAEEDFEKALQEAFAADSKILIEEEIPGRELECSILGALPDIKVSGVGEIALNGAEFYSYDAKYIDPDAASVVLPAENLEETTKEKIRDMTRKCAVVLGLRGLARVDFRLHTNGEVYVNEVNTLPGFTNISMYPKHFMQEGYSYPKLISELIEGALSNKKA